MQNQVAQVSCQIALEIDGKNIGVANVEMTGAFHGFDETTKAKDMVRNWKLTDRCFYLLSFWQTQPDGSTYGMEGIFEHGEWATTEEGKPLYRVWERLV